MAVRVRADRRVTLTMVHIAGVHVPQPFLHRDPPRPHQRVQWRRRHVHHSVRRMERGEVQRHVHAAVLADPRTFGVQLRIVVVVPGDQQRRQFHPRRGLDHRILDRVQHVPQMGAGHRPVERLREPLQVDVRRVHRPVEVGPGHGGHVPGRHRDRMDAQLPADRGRVDRVLGEHNRVVVRERHRLHAVVGRHPCNPLGRGLNADVVPVAGARDVPVLAEPAGRIATRRAEAQHARTGQEMVERLLLDRVDGEA